MIKYHATIISRYILIGVGCVIANCEKLDIVIDVEWIWIVKFLVVVDFKMATEDQETKRLKLALMGRYNTIFVLPYIRVLTGKHIYNLYIST